MSRTGEYYQEQKEKSAEQELYKYAFESHFQLGEHENANPEGGSNCMVCTWLQEVGFLADSGDMEPEDGNFDVHQNVGELKP